MDRIKETADLIIELNHYKKGELKDFKFISSVCSYFDLIKNEALTQNDFKFLKFIANSSGIPHFYNILEQFNQKPNIDSFDLNTFSSLYYESTLHTDENSMLHKFQKEILDRFVFDKQNRFFLSASTSFGKTHIVFEIIKKMGYPNIVLIFPTIALLSENMERILSEPNYAFFRENYSIHTLSEVKELGERNIFIYTPERYLSFTEKSQHNIDFDFVFVDEVYKIDNDYLIDEQVKENERDVAYRLAVFYALYKKADVLLAGPYMDFAIPESPDYNPSFDNFLKDNGISLVNYNDYEIVNKTYLDIRRKKSYPEDSQLNISYSSNRKTDKLLETVNAINSISQNLIVYCANRGRNGGVEYYADAIIKSGLLDNHSNTEYQELINHISSNFTNKWILLRALKKGIGIHHGLIPKYIQKEIISLFNNGYLKVLISTTTITEGVNTSAKNLVVMHSSKGNKDLKKFDAKNIAGRAGRFGYHYNGRVIDLSNSFMNIINGKDEILKHKNYDINAPKDEIDLFYSKDEYLSDADIAKRRDVVIEQIKRKIPDEILSQYKVISRIDKIKVYDSIAELTDVDFKQIKRLIQIINYKLDIEYDGFQIVLNAILPIVKNQELRFLIEYTGKRGEHSMLTSLIHYYLDGGFKSSIRYHLGAGKSIDEAVKLTAKFVYNTLKYQTVKYLGVFNLMYKHYISQKHNQKFEDVSGLDKLLLKFEHNALTDEGRIASDYGVPSSVVDYYENEDRRVGIKSKFDNYELNSFNKIDKIINKE
ncbi:MAG: DEAD/DEAH box helicase family protein [Candidatus Delongbacteria bacterium]|nr:DEAD/DEAH box helicase family protein [Candidatus Delongbacteria bacterium]